MKQYMVVGIEMSKTRYSVLLYDVTEQHCNRAKNVINSLSDNNNN
jgi:hypothetical protein